MEAIYNDKVKWGAAVRRVIPTLTVTFEAGVIAAAVGIATYFVWPVEPDWRFAVLVLGLVAILSVWPRSPFGGLISFVLLGFSWTALHTAIISPNPIAFEQRYQVSGAVLDIDQSGPMRRLMISVDAIDPMPRTGLPAKVRLRVGRNFPEVDIGQGISVPAVIGPLPGPAVPDGYDPARRAFYDRLAGTGFAIADPSPFSPDLTAREKFGITITKWRRVIAARVLDRSPPETKGLQAALLTGLRDDIPDTQREALRASGLAHILAISGLHMGMVSFGVFTLISALLAVLPQAAARDMRKPAALFAIVAATLYLGLSGASVATQRAYIMVSIAFLAVLLDRRALSLRSVAVAAALTLTLRPEALMSVGFQMSFAAVTALVVVYREWADRWPRQKVQSFRDRVVGFYGSLAGTSLVAGFATGGFAMFHFGRIAHYGLLGNLAAMAVFPLVMALGIIALLLMPLGLESLPLWAMGQCLRGMLWIANWVAGLPGAVGTVKASHPLALAIYSAGFVSACFATRRSLIVGILCMGLAAVIWQQTPTAEIRITDTGRVSVLTQDGGFTSSARADQYGRRQFARSLGDTDLVWTTYQDRFAQCDALACRFQVKDAWVTVVNEASEVKEACRDSALVILPERDATRVAKRACEALLLDATNLRDMGGAHILVQDALIVQPIIDPKRANRPWG